MNFYMHHLGDYDRDTSHLSWDEDCAYRRLICLYYKTERPLPADTAKVCRLIRASRPHQIKAVKSVLNEFFSLGENGFSHFRCEGELQRSYETNKRNSLNGKKGGIARAKRALSERLASQTPDSRLHKILSSTDENPSGVNPKLEAESPSDRLWREGSSYLTGKGMREQAARSFLGKLRKSYEPEDVLKALDGARAENAIDPPAFITRWLKNGTHSGLEQQEEIFRGCS